MATLHVHVWQDDEIVEEIDLELTDAYVSGEQDDHIQFGGMIQGKQVEVRLFVRDLPEIEKMVKNEGGP